MAHNLYKNRMMYVGQKPWHGLGTELKEPATAAEAIAAARLGWQVVKMLVYFKDESEASFDIVPDKFTTVNQENKKPLGIVSDNYKIVQNTEAFGFFDSVVGTGEAIYHTAGALGQGEQIWLLAKLPKDLVLFREDVVEKFLCLTNSHDGKSALRVYFTPIRVVCQNTLNMSMGDASRGVTIRHTGNIQNKVVEARRVLGFALKFYEEFDVTAQAFAERKLNTERATRYFEDVLEMDEKKEVSTRTSNIRADMLELFDRGLGAEMPSIRHSLWAAYNAVCEWTDHCMTVKSETANPSNRLK